MAAHRTGRHRRGGAASSTGRGLEPARTIRCLARHWIRTSAAWVSDMAGARRARSRLVAVAAIAGLAPSVRQFAGVVKLEAQRVDHRAGEQAEAEQVEPEQGDQDEPEGRAE